MVVFEYFVYNHIKRCNMNGYRGLFFLSAAWTFNLRVSIDIFTFIFFFSIIELSLFKGVTFWNFCFSGFITWNFCLELIVLYFSWVQDKAFYIWLNFFLFYGLYNFSRDQLQLNHFPLGVKMTIPVGIARSLWKLWAPYPVPWSSHILLTCCTISPAKNII